MATQRLIRSGVHIHSFPLFKLAIRVGIGVSLPPPVLSRPFTHSISDPNKVIEANEPEETLNPTKSTPLLTTPPSNAPSNAPSSTPLIIPSSSLGANANSNSPSNTNVYTPSPIPPHTLSPQQQQLVRQRQDEMRKLVNLQQLAKLQAKLHKENSTLPASLADIEEKVTKQEQLVAQLDLEISQPPKLKYPRSVPLSEPRRPYQRPRSAPKWEMNHLGKPLGAMPVNIHVGVQASNSPVQLAPQPGDKFNSQLEDKFNFQLGGKFDSLGDRPQTMSERRKSRRLRKLHVDSTTTSAPSLKSQESNGECVRLTEDLSTQQESQNVTREWGGPGTSTQVTDQHELSPHVYLSYRKGLPAWRTAADSRRAVSTAPELALELRILLYRMLEEGDFSGCREVLEYMLSNGITFPNSSTCEFLLSSAARARDIHFAEWFLATMVARQGATGAMYSCVGNLKYHLKDFAGSVSTFTAMRNNGLMPSPEGLRTLLTAVTQIGDPHTFAEIASNIKDQQSNFFTLTSLKLLSILRTKGLEAESAKLLAHTETLLRPDYRFYTTLLHMAARIDDHERFYSLLKEMRSAAITPTMSSFSELVASLKRTGRGGSESYSLLLDTIRQHGLVPDANFLALLDRFEVLDSRRASNSQPQNEVLDSRRASNSQSQSSHGPPTQQVLPSKPVRSKPKESLKGTPKATSNPVSLVRTQHTEKDRKEAVVAALSLLDKGGVWDMLDVLASRQVLLDLTFYNSLLDMLSRKEKLRECREILREMDARRVTPDVLSYNSVLAATKHPRVDDYRRLVGEMKAKGVAPNERTYSGFLALLCMRRHWTEFDKVLAEMRVAGVNINVGTYGIILSAAGKRGNLEVATHAAEAMKKLGYPLGPGAYTSLILAACSQNATPQAVQYLSEMKTKHIIPELIACNRIMQNWAKSGAAKECGSLLEDLKRLGVKPNAESYATVLKASLNQPGQDLKGMTEVSWEVCSWLLKDMQENGVVPDEKIYVPIADYMARMGDRGHFNEICGKMRERNMPPDAQMHALLVERLANTQEFEQAVAVIHDMRAHALKPDGFTYAALLNGLVAVGKWSECEAVLQDLNEDDKVKALCSQLVLAAKTGDDVKRSKVTALLQPINKPLLYHPP